METTHAVPGFGDVLRAWRARRGVSQLALALDAGVSQRHLSFVESGRARPSREMVLRLAEQLDVPLRQQNRMLVAAGFAPLFAERALGDPALDTARHAVELVLAGHEPFPALAVDRHWSLVAANASVAPMLLGADPALLSPPVNVLRLSLHPDGMARRIVNYGDWRHHILTRLRRQIDASGDPTLESLHEELRGYAAPAAMRDAMRAPRSDNGVFVPLRLDVGDTVLSLLSTTTVFGTPVDVTLAELAMECFFPADDGTAAWLRNRAGR